MDGDTYRKIATIIFGILIVISSLYNLYNLGIIDIDFHFDMQHQRPPVYHSDTDQITPPEITFITLASEVNGLGDYTPIQNLNRNEGGYVYYEYCNVCHDHQVQTKQEIAFFEIESGVCYANIPVYFPLLKCGNFFEKEGSITTWETYCTDTECYTSVQCHVSSIRLNPDHKARVTITDMITGGETEATLFYTVE